MQTEGVLTDLRDIEKGPELELEYQVKDRWNRNPKMAGSLNPKPMKVTVYTTVDQWSDTMP